MVTEAEKRNKMDYRPLFFFKILFIYLTEREQKQGEQEREREKHAPH